MLVQVCVCAVKVQVGFRDIIKWTICTNVDQVWRNIGLYLSGLEGILAVIIIYKPRAGQTTPDRGGSCVVKCSFVTAAASLGLSLGGWRTTVSMWHMLTVGGFSSRTVLLSSITYKSTSAKSLHALAFNCSQPGDIIWLIAVFSGRRYRNCSITDMFPTCACVARKAVHGRLPSRNNKTKEKKSEWRIQCPFCTFLRSYKINTIKNNFLSAKNY